MKLTASMSYNTLRTRATAQWHSYARIVYYGVGVIFCRSREKELFKSGIMYELAKSGRWVGGNPPTGYRSAETVGSITVDGKHEGIIEGKRWVEVHHLLEKNRDKAYRKPKSNTALLSGPLFLRRVSGMTTYEKAV